MQVLKQSLLNALDNTELNNKFHNTCYNVLFKKVYVIAYGFSNSYADDITQDYFIKVMKMDLNKLKPHASYIDKYLLRTAVNHCKDFIKKNKNKPFWNVSKDLSDCVNMAGGLKPSLSEPSEYLLSNGFAKTLTSKQYIALYKKMEGYSIKEIAKDMKTTNGAVKNLIYRARKTLIREYYLH